MLICEGTLYASKTRPLVTTTSAGDFQLSLLLMDRQSHHTVEPWRLVWVGDVAHHWWKNHAEQWAPGLPLYVAVNRMQPLATSRFIRPEIHACVMDLQLAPARHSPTAPTNPCNQPEVQPA